MTDETQAAPEADDLDLEIKAALEESATSENEPKPEAEAEEQKPEEEFVPTDNEKVQARFDKLTWEKNEAKREAEALRKRLEQVDQQQPQAETPEEPTLEDFNLEDFNFDSDARNAAYVKAYAKWEAQNQVSSYFETQKQRDQENAQKAKQLELTEKFLSEAEKYAEEHPSYYKDVATLPELSQDKLDLIRSVGVKAVHYLAKNPEEANKFASADFGSAAMQLGMISARLSTNQKTTTSSKAPEPVETITGSGKQSKSYDEMSMEEIYNLP